MEQTSQKKPNRLVSEKSPYLLEHAYNPVDWYPWSEEAFLKSRDENKPIFLSIGYSSCHWCHRMNQDCFENEVIAGILNESFVAIKVDREERPDVDEVYMKAVQAMTGSGGWPLSVFLTPDLKPFYGGTYFPPQPMHGLPSFPQVLNHIIHEWKEKRGEIAERAQEFTDFLKKAYVVKPGELPTENLSELGYAALVSNYDPEYGGFGAAPKFPLPTYLMFLHRYYHRTRKQLALKCSIRTLEAMSAGGMHDQLAGGFHRYSTDRRWLVPHFEKMLYDNALLARGYLEAYQLTQDPALSKTSKGILSWVMREMTHADRGFYSAQDADTDQGEGVYYTWTPEETKAVLGEREAEILNFHYGVTEQGNFEESRTILHEENSLEKTASKFNLKPDELATLLEDAKKKLLQARLERPRPHTDDKILASWNGLAISAFAYGYQALGEADYLRAARGCAEFISAKMIKSGRLVRRYRDGEAAIEGTLEDYSYFVQGLLDLYEAGLEPRWLKDALRLSGQMVELFWDTGGGGFFFNSTRDSLLAEIKEDYDGPTPSGNSVAALNLLRLSEFTGDDRLREKAEIVFKVFHDKLEEQPSAHTYLLSALEFYLSRPKEIVLVVPSMDEEAMRMMREIQSRFLPNKVLTAIVGDEPPFPSPLTDGKNPVDEKPTVYICENFACKAPVNNPKELRRQLSS